MKNPLSLSIVALSLLTAAAFAQSNMIPVEQDQTQEAPAKGKPGKKHKKEQKKKKHGKKKGHKKGDAQVKDENTEQN